MLYCQLYASEHIGKGSFAEVRLAQHILTGTEMAVKIREKWGFAEVFQVYCLKILNQPNITKLFAVITTQNQHFLLMQHVSREHVFYYLENYCCRIEEEVQAMFLQLISAVQYCHQRRIMHQDPKPENIPLYGELNIKLTNFGFSTQC